MPTSPNPSPLEITKLLARARAAIDEDRLDQALAPLLRVWAGVRAPELADLIEALSDRLAQTRPPLTGATRSELAQHWITRAESADAIELGVLLPSLVDTDSYQARTRLKLVARHAPDPRIASTLAALVVEPPFFSSSTAKFWKTLHEQLLASADPRALARLEQVPALAVEASAMAERLDRWRRRSVAQLEPTLATTQLSLEPDDRALVLRLSEALAFAREHERAHDPGPELLAAIHANPGELELRQVYADYLQAKGDPRGEFIALQLADSRTGLDRAGKARVNALVREHGYGWLGSAAWALVRRQTEFRNGFLATARIKRNVRGLERVLDDPLWSTVERLEHAPPSLVQAQSMRALVALRWTARQTVAAHQELELRLDRIVHLTIENDSWQSGWVGLAGGLEHLRAPLEGPSMFPSLRELVLELGASVDPDQLAWMWVGQLGERLTGLELQFTSDGVLGLSGYLRSLRSARGSSSGLESVEIRNRLLRCRFEHLGERAWARAVLAPGPAVQAGEVAAELALLRGVDGLELQLEAGLGAIANRLEDHRA